MELLPELKEEVAVVSRPPIPGSFFLSANEIEEKGDPLLLLICNFYQRYCLCYHYKQVEA